MNGYIYGAMYEEKKWSCIDAATGKIQYTSDILGHGAIIRADDLFYCYSEDGEMALVDADPTSFKVISKFKVPLGTDQHWSHPVIHNGRLYIRHGNALMVYDVKSK